MSTKTYALIAALILPMLAQGSSEAKAGWVNISSKNVSFSYPMSMGTKLKTQEVKAFPLPNPDDKPDDVAPKHFEATFANTNAQVFAFPTKDAGVKSFKAAYPPVADAIQDLGPILKSKSPQVKDVPILPWRDASTPFHAHVKYLDFKSGSAIRYVATYQIEPEVVSNDGLMYVMQGLSKDGKYYVSAFIPIKTKTLPAKSPVSTWSAAKYEEFSKNFQDYAAKEKSKIEKLSDGSFSPSLAELDELVSTLKVQ